MPLGSSHLPPVPHPVSRGEVGSSCRLKPLALRLLDLWLLLGFLSVSGLQPGKEQEHSGASLQKASLRLGRKRSRSCSHCHGRLWLGST